MTTPSSFAAAAGVMFLTGIGIPIFAALNGGLGRSLESPVAATAVTFAVGLTISVAALAVVGAPSAARFSAVSPHSYAGAAFIVFYALAVTYFAPRIGVGNAVFFVLLGQLVAAAVIDHFSLLGAEHFGLSPRRILGIVLMAAGVWLAKRTA
jgi:transporter family-2 protein